MALAGGLPDSWSGRRTKFEVYIPPLIFPKRLSDVLEDEGARLAQELGDRELAEQVVDEGHVYVSF